MKSQIILIIKSLIIILCISCQGEKSHQNTLINVPKTEVDHTNKLKITLPDNVLDGQKFKIKAVYDTTLTKEERQGIEDRLLYFHFYIDQNPQQLSLDELINIDDHFIIGDSLNTGNFNYEMAIQESGEKFFHGVLEDIRLGYNEKDQTLGYKITVIITKKITVLDSTQIK